MEILTAYTKNNVQALTRKRQGEEKLGDYILTTETEWQECLSTSKARFVIVGIPEDIGVMANYGRAGAGTAFKPAIESFLNQQNNAFLNAQQILLLGEVVVNDLLKEAWKYNAAKDVPFLRQLVQQLDERVSSVIQAIVSEQKIPIVIGGGHNNAYGNIKGASLALSKKINAINCDPHLDFRPMEGRHSGNGFSYAFEEGYLDKYAVFAMHEQYNNQAALQKFSGNKQRLFYSTFESVFVREEQDVKTSLGNCINFVKPEPCGIELDLDAITNVPSSAKTSSGISALQARQYSHRCAMELEAVYLHIAEGAPVLSHIKADNKTGKLIAYLVSDFIKGRERRDMAMACGK